MLKKLNLHETIILYKDGIGSFNGYFKYYFVIVVISIAGSFI